jgi:hypothetical protein
LQEKISILRENETLLKDNERLNAEKDSLTKSREAANSQVAALMKSLEAAHKEIKEKEKMVIFSFFFENYKVQRRRSRHAHTLTPMNTHTQTLPL